jgi:hypothetical protein
MFSGLMFPTPHGVPRTILTSSRISHPTCSCIIHVIPPLTFNLLLHQSVTPLDFDLSLPRSIHSFSRSTAMSTKKGHNSRSLQMSKLVISSDHSGSHDNTQLRHVILSSKHKLTNILATEFTNLIHLWSNPQNEHNPSPIPQTHNNLL